ncbi:MAG: hypothetical protein R3250_08360 [Melioribacteraceae bacterium]|nr:hypothetical protein [Melioribacteraceae bacterium]
MADFQPPFSSSPEEEPKPFGGDTGGFPDAPVPDQTTIVDEAPQLAEEPPPITSDVPPIAEETPTLNNEVPDLTTEQAPPTFQQGDPNAPLEGQEPLPGHTLPTEVDAYKPLEVQQQIAEITPAKFDNLTKVLGILVKNNPDRIVIRNSKINESVQSSIIAADIEQILGPNINFEITDPKKHVDLFRSFKGNNNIFILDDPENTRYIITNGPIKIFLPKQVDQLVADTAPPDLSNCQGVCFKELNKDTKDEIKSIGKHSTSIEYLIHNNEIKAMHIPDTGIYRFEEFINDPDIAKLDETNAQLVLKSEFFLPVDADAYRIDIVKNQEGSLISVTQCNAGMVKISVFEHLEDTTGGNIQF